MDRNFLFICGKARMRSPTAADIIGAIEGIHTDFAGLSTDADEKLSSEQVAWADEIFVMEKRHKKRLVELFGGMLKDKKIKVLGVPDKYSYMDPALVDILRSKLGVFLV